VQFLHRCARSRIFFRTLLAALNGQIRLSHLNARYRPQNRDGDRKSEESLKTGPCNLISSDVIKTTAQEISLFFVNFPSININRGYNDSLTWILWLI